MGKEVASGRRGDEDERQDRQRGAGNPEDGTAERPDAPGIDDIDFDGRRQKGEKLLGLAGGVIPATGACNCKAPGQRGRHAKTCPAAGAGQASPAATSNPAKKPAPGGKAYDAATTTMMVKALLATGFSITATRAGDHWKLSEPEAQALAEPIVSIMARHDLLKYAGQYGDYAALIAAVGMIVIPKVMISKELRARRKAVTTNNVQSIRSVQKPAATATGGGGNSKPAASANERHDQAVRIDGSGDVSTNVKQLIAGFGG